MKLLSALFHFLGGVKCALLLLTAAAAAVVAGTILEGSSDSHEYASSYVYSHPLFACLLALFFINILFSTLRRWPFRFKHIPFLITHVGLLMVIGGAILKQQIGTQGYLILWEGSGSHRLILPHTFALSIERLGSDTQIPLHHFSHHRPLHQSQFPSLQTRMLSFAPHAKALWRSWIQQGKALISGLPPFEAPIWKIGEPLPSGIRARLYPEQREAEAQIWQIRALQTEAVPEALEKFYLDFQADPGHPLFALLLVKNSREEIFLFALDHWGKIHGERFDQQMPEHLVSYGEGTGGYALQTTLPFLSPSFENKAAARAGITLETPVSLAFQPAPPPLKLEERTPCLLLEFEEAGWKQKICLGYDSTGFGLKWPILGGAYLVHFGPQALSIPHHVRLRQARQTSYPDSTQPESYAADLLITGKKGPVEVTLSMNRVYETEDGYRFYLAGVGPFSEGKARQAKIIVNYDPVKYILTYPGAILLSCGILLLFWILKSHQRL